MWLACFLALSPLSSPWQILIRLPQIVQLQLLTCFVDVAEAALVPPPRAQRSTWP